MNREEFTVALESDDGQRWLREWALITGRAYVNYETEWKPEVGNQAMKALSVRQPHAGLIVVGIKRYETRSWHTRYRGDVLLCASAAPSNLGPAGVALAIVELIDCRPMTPADAPVACTAYKSGLYVWELANVRLTRHFPVHGRLRLFEVDFEPDEKQNAI